MKPGRGGAIHAPKRFLRALFRLAFLAIGIWLWWALAREGFHYEWQWNRLWRHLGHFGADGFVPGPLLRGIWLTIRLAVCGFFLSIALGICCVVLRLGPWLWGNLLSRLYIAIWRNTPLLLQLFFAYFVLSPIFHTDPFWTAVLALGAFEGAYMGEILRAGVLSVSPGQWEAALSLGLNIRQTFLGVIFPQACANTWPALTNQAVAILKETSLVGAIAVADLTMQSQAIVAETFLAFEVWLFAGGCYLLMAFAISAPGMWFEKYGKR